MKVGLLVIATNKYIDFVQPLLNGADQFFLKNHDVTYFVFTNNNKELSSSRNIVKVETEHKDWPWMTLGRYEIFFKNMSLLKEMDYLYYIDADMLIVDDIGDEIFGDLVVTQHPGYYGRRGTPEYRPESLAYIPVFKDIQYFAGGFNGGTSKEYLTMAQVLSHNIAVDYSRGIVAIWHDESHLNRYAADYPNLTILSPSYCYGEHMDIPFNKKIIALTKKHEELRK